MTMLDEFITLHLFPNAANINSTILSLGKLQPPSCHHDFVFNSWKKSFRWQSTITLKASTSIAVSIDQILDTSLIVYEI